MDNSDTYIEKSALEKLNYALEVEKLTYELSEHLANSVKWLNHYCKTNNIPLPDQDKINEIVDKAVKLNDDFNRKFTEDGIHRRLYRASKQVLSTYRQIF
ncbi:hypothetical protein [Nitrosopumilus ureiphilus]|uniref:hypothetical protein n=1 Tax=Nitrosopumilus ureiphilus TaxID=1470067 RepID=UPI0015C96C86|nr:hypothetical protein [Nitrosopumilus ureiphilus]